MARIEGMVNLFTRKKGGARNDPRFEENNDPTFTKKDFEVLLSEDGLKRYYYKIKEVLREYMDLEESDYSLISIWIIGTHFHKQFPSYPYLFFNAMKGSGKSRMLKIIACLSNNGKVVGSMTEAVLFRTASLRTLCIDEFESMNAKGNENLKLLLNSAYKRGLSVERLRKNKEGGQDVEEFEVYCPIAMANIWGMENVLSDRCVTIVLEKSSNNTIIKLIENFEGDIGFQTIKGGLTRITKKLTAELNIFGDIFRDWNFYQKNNVNYVKDVNKVSKLSNVNNIGISDISYSYKVLFSKIDNTNLSGRDLELFFPLFIIADIIGEEVLTELIQTSKIIIKERKETDREESRDVRLIEFLAQSNYVGFVDVAKVVNDFKAYLGEEETWINVWSIGRALKRTRLVLDKRSTGKNRQVKLNILKAQEKLRMFKDPEEAKRIPFTDEEIKEAGYTKEELGEILDE